VGQTSDPPDVEFHPIEITAGQPPTRRSKASSLGGLKSVVSTSEAQELNKTEAQRLSMLKTQQIAQEYLPYIHLFTPLFINSSTRDHDPKCKILCLAAHFHESKL